jgi:hypothetical protein
MKQQAYRPPTVWSVAAAVGKDGLNRYSKLGTPPRTHFRCMLTNVCGAHERHGKSVHSASTGLLRRVQSVYAKPKTDKRGDCRTAPRG